MIKKELRLVKGLITI